MHDIKHGHRTDTGKKIWKIKFAIFLNIRYRHSGIEQIIHIVHHQLQW